MMRTKQKKLKLWILIFAIITAATTGAFAAPTGLSLEEYRSNTIIDLPVSRSRLFRIPNRITRTSIGDPNSAEPVVLSMHEITVIGKTPGKTTLGLWDDVGNVSVFAVRVTGDPSPAETVMKVVGNLGLATQFSKAIPPAEVKALSLDEFKTVYVGPASGALQTAQSNQKLKTPGTSNQRQVYDIVSPSANRSSWIGFRLVKASEAPKDPETNIAIDVAAGSSRIFKLNHNLARFSMSAPEIAEPVVVSETEIVVQAKKTGTAIFGLWDREGNKFGLEVRVRKDDGGVQSAIGVLSAAGSTGPLGATGATIRHAEANSVDPSEIKATLEVELEPTRAVMYKTKNPLIRVAVANPSIAEPLPSENGVNLWGKAQGNTTVFLWDNAGNVLGVDVHVRGGADSEARGSSEKIAIRPDAHSAARGSIREVEAWTGSSKSIWEFPPR